MQSTQHTLFLGTEMTSATDGYGNLVTRDTRGLSGGIAGHVNTALTSYTIAGKDVKQFEWNFLALLDNYADAGENCAMYAQGNKHGIGPTWGACIEACDTTPVDSTGLVGAEVDCWVTGADNGLRFGVDVVVGDSLFIRQGKRSDYAVATYGQRIAACASTPWAKWSYGSHITDYLHAGIHLESKATRAIHIEGEHVVAIDLGNNKGQTAIRLPEGGRITLDQYDQIALSRVGDRVHLTNGATPVFSIDVVTGDIYKMGKKVL